LKTTADFAASHGCVLVGHVNTVNIIALVVAELAIVATISITMYNETSISNAATILAIVVQCKHAQTSKYYQSLRGSFTQPAASKS